MKLETINSKNFAKVIKKVIKSIKEGGVAIFPTDTVPGFICDAGNKKAVEKIFKIKNRPKSKPLPIFVKDIQAAKDLAEINKNQENFLKKNWPGKVTVVLKRRGCLKIYGVDKDTIALRVPKCRYLNELLKEINIPLAQTSVNISGQTAITDAKHDLKVFKNKKDKPDLIIYSAKPKKSLPSKIFDLTNKKIRILR